MVLYPCCFPSRLFSLGSPQPARGMLSLPSCWGCCLEQHQPPQISPHARGVPDAGPWGRLTQELGFVLPGLSTGDSTRSRRGRAGVRGEPLPFLALLQHGQVLRGCSHGRKGGRKCSETAIFCCSLPLYGQHRCLRWAGPDLGTHRVQGRGAKGPPLRSLATQSTATCLASFSPPSLKISSPSDPG